MKSVRLVPYCTKAIWGGKNLNKKYGKTAFEEVAEAWELSGYPGKESTVIGGECDKMTMTELIASKGNAILGTKCADGDKFPLLIKFIDAASPLSIQVHPDDEMAIKLGADGGKTEMWVICEAEPDAFLYYGVKEDMSPDAFASSITDGSITEYLNKVPVKPGDVFFIRAGTIHAIGAGITICEIQQTSDTTYRLFDYNRKDANGNTRELHIEKGKIASKLTPPDNIYEKGRMLGDENILVECPFFTTSSFDVSGEISFNVDSDSFSSLTVTDGEGDIVTTCETYSVKKGDTIFIFAGAGEVKLNGNMKVIRAKV